MAIRCLPNILREFLLSITVSWWKVRLDVASCEGFANTFCIRVKHNMLNIEKHFQYHHLSVGWKDNERCVRVKKKTCTKPSTFTQHALVLPIYLIFARHACCPGKLDVDHPCERFLGGPSLWKIFLQWRHALSPSPPPLFVPRKEIIRMQVNVT
jgi:hypothetical protein